MYLFLSYSKKVRKHNFYLYCPVSLAGPQRYKNTLE